MTRAHRSPRAPARAGGAAQRSVAEPPFDLNLLTVFDALVATGSVTVAARRLGVTQSAVSHALARLRERAGDALFVRAGTGMVLTAYAEGLAAKVTPALADLRRALVHRDAFDPSTSRRTFTILAAEYPELVLVPLLSARLAARAPFVDLAVKRATDEELRAFDRGEHDLVLAVRAEGFAGVRQRVLLEDPFVVILRADHPAASAPLTLDRYIELRHVLVSPRGGPKGGTVDEALRRAGLTRRSWARVPNFVPALTIVAGSDAVTALPARLAAAFARPLGLTTAPLPIDIPPARITCLWHERNHADAAQTWLRSCLVSVARGDD